MGINNSKKKTKKLQIECFKNEIGHEKFIPVWLNSQKSTLIYITHDKQIIEMDIIKKKILTQFEITENFQHITKAEINDKMDRIIIDPINPILVAQMPKFTRLIIIDIAQKNSRRIEIEHNYEHPLILSPQNIGFDDKILVSKSELFNMHGNSKSVLFTFNLKSQELHPCLAFKYIPEFVTACWKRKFVLYYKAEFYRFEAFLVIRSLDKLKILKRIRVGMVQDRTRDLKLRLNSFDPHSMLLSIQTLDFLSSKIQVVNIFNSQYIDNYELNKENLAFSNKDKFYIEYYFYSDQNGKLENDIERELKEKKIFYVKKEFEKWNLIMFRVLSSVDFTNDKLMNYCLFWNDKMKFVYIKKVMTNCNSRMEVEFSV